MVLFLQRLRGVMTLKREQKTLAGYPGASCRLSSRLYDELRRPNGVKGIAKGIIVSRNLIKQYQLPLNINKASYKSFFIVSIFGEFPERCFCAFILRCVVRANVYIVNLAEQIHNTGDRKKYETG